MNVSELPFCWVQTPVQVMTLVVPAVVIAPSLLTAVVATMVPSVMVPVKVLVLVLKVWVPVRETVPLVWVIPFWKINVVLVPVIVPP